MEILASEYSDTTDFSARAPNRYSGTVTCFSVVAGVTVSGTDSGLAKSVTPNSSELPSCTQAAGTCTLYLTVE